MEEKDNLQDVLSELKKVLGDLTKEEKQQVVEKIEKKLGEASGVTSAVFNKGAQVAQSAQSAAKPAVEYYPNTKVPVSGPDSPPPPKPVIPVPAVVKTDRQVPSLVVEKPSPVQVKPSEVPPSAESAPETLPGAPEPPSTPISIPRITPISFKPSASARIAPVAQSSPLAQHTPSAPVPPSVNPPDKVQSVKPAAPRIETESLASLFGPAVPKEPPTAPETKSQYSQTLKSSVQPKKDETAVNAFKPIFRPSVHEQPVEPAAPTAASAAAHAAPEQEKPSVKPSVTAPEEKASPAPVVQATPQIIKSNAAGVMVELPKQSSLSAKEGTLKFACFFPAGQDEQKETFLKNLLDVFKKTSKKPVTPENVLELGIDVISVNWKEIMQKCREKEARVIFLIYADEYDPAEIKNTVLGSGMFFYGIQVSHINRKLTYVDLVIELMLHKG